MPPPKRAPRKNNGAAAPPSPDPHRSSPPDPSDEDEEEGVPAKKIPEELVARILHEFFKREDTRVSRAASKALGRYFEIFVQEAIARTKQERGGRFLEVSRSLCVLVPCSPTPLVCFGSGETEGKPWVGQLLTDVCM